MAIDLPPTVTVLPNGYLLIGPVFSAPAAAVKDLETVECPPGFVRVSSSDPSAPKCAPASKYRLVGEELQGGPGAHNEPE